MLHKNKRYPTIANAIIWAAMIIASALLMKGSDGAQTMLLLLIAGWFATHNLINTSHSHCSGQSQENPDSRDGG